MQVLAARGPEAVLRERAKEPVERRARGRGDVQDTERALGRREGRDGGESAAARDVVHRDHVHGIVDVGDKPELDAALDETPDEVVRICHYNHRHAVSVKRKATIRQ